MARQNIYTGAVANDGTGDTLRAAAEKINETFVEVYQKLGVDGNNLSTQISLEDSAIVFEGASVDAFETRLTASDVNSDVIIRLPDSNGVAIVDIATQTMTNKTINNSILNSPKIITSINDSSNNELIKFDPQANADTEITIANAAGGGAPSIKTTSSASNADMTISAKGAGVVEINKLALDTVTINTDGQTASSQYSSILCTPSASGFDVTVGNGSALGELKVIMNISSTFSVLVTPTNFQHTGYSGFVIPPDTSAMMVWNGFDWSILSNLSSVTLQV
jgi:hypothetical protein